MVDNISTHNIKPHQKCKKKKSTQEKLTEIAYPGFVIGTKILCTERSQHLIIASIKGTIQLAVMQPPLARGRALI